ncbi:iron complex outermembrane receptor protein [Methylobacterium brachiatum]|uniref:Iron complex outermembrane receptor protein n=1 Tax=Methylobacterium brachiatum TaxID=269660 RepID=A0AAJ1WX95_9HYPH|nr:TonB-dependent siderophore receptor [Methylobacterium brachiatum]MCB4803262.1 TonB-dependent siderophore receptor [Methylobacterium brachiatum]MDQ0543990.1 iron complex outermembrane receptor protein [Methylobacterium brachiatum]
MRGLLMPALAAGLSAVAIGRALAQDPARAAPQAVTLDELSVESRDGAARDPGLPPPTGTIGRAPAPFAGGQVASGGRLGFLGNRSVFDTPFTQSNYTEELIRNQQAQTLADVFANNPSVRDQQPPFGSQPSSFIRGFFVNSRDYAFDGLYGITNTYRPAVEGIERVEILSGPGAFLYGFPPSGSAVGVINLVPKRAAATPLTRVSAQYLSTGHAGGTFDVGRRFGDGDAVGVRINGAYRNGATPIDRQNLGLGFLSLGLDVRGEALRLSLDAGYQHLDLDAESNGLTVLPGVRIPRAPRLTLNVQQPWERSDIEHGFGVLRAEYDLAPDATLFGAVGGSLATRDFFRTQSTITDAAGRLRQQIRTVSADNRQWTGEVGLRARIDTGPIRHSVAVVATHYAMDEPFATALGPQQVRSALYAPILVARPSRPVPRPNVTTLSELDGLAVTDTASILDGRVELMAGGRFQAVTRDLALPGGGFSSRYDKSAATPMTALIVKPWDRLSLYASYAEGFGFGPNPPGSAVNAGATFPPVRTSQIETGAKLDLDPVGVTLAFFEIAQPSGVLDPRTFVFSLNGEQHNQGIDLAVFGAPAEGVRVLAGLTLIDGRLSKTAGRAYDGHVAPGVPGLQANLGGEVDLPAWMLPGVTLTGRVIYTASQYYDQANTQTIPDWTRLDLGIRHSFTVNGTPLTARFNVENAAGARYWASTGYNALSYGTPRTLLASLTADF